MRCISERLIGNVTILDLVSRPMLGEMNTEVTDRIRALIHQGRTDFLLDLEGVSYLDSNGLGDITAAHQTAARQGARVKLVNLQPRVAELLRIVNLRSVFEIFDSQQEALQSFD